MAENRVIGRGGTLPWHLPADMKRFKSLTTGHVIVMGRKTFESIGRPLPNRRHVVLTRNRRYQPEGASVVTSLSEALRLAEGEQEIFVVGGAEIYRLALPHADRLHLTIVHADVVGDACFPKIDWNEWTLLDDVRHAADEKHSYPYSFRRYERRRKKVRTA